MSLAPSCLPPHRAECPERPVFPGAWDTHAHVIGPHDKYPLQPDRSYTPIECVEADYLQMLSTLGMDRGVVVQPSIYGTDNRLTVDVVRRSGGRLRGIVVLGEDADRELIRHYHAAGIRGFRINVLFLGGPGMELLERTARTVAEFGWHAQLLLDIRTLPELLPRLRELPVPVVFDHMGHFPFELGVDWTGFHMMLDLLRGGRAHAKLSGSYRLSSSENHVADVSGIAHRLVEEAADRLVWGSDWPHVGLFRHMPRTERLLDGLCDWCPDPASRKAILVDNPARLYA